MKMIASLSRNICSRLTCALVIIAMLAVFSSPALADCSDDKTCYYVYPGTPVPISPTAFGNPSPSCKKVTNNCSIDPKIAIMVPTGSQAEWGENEPHSFITAVTNNTYAHSETGGSCVTLADCDKYSVADTQYGSCSGACGGGNGTQPLVSWTCQQNDITTNTTTTVDNSVCTNAGIAPPSTQACTNDTACIAPVSSGQCTPQLTNMNSSDMKLGPIPPGYGNSFTFDLFGGAPPGTPLTYYPNQYRFGVLGNNYWNAPPNCKTTGEGRSSSTTCGPGTSSTFVRSFVLTIPAGDPIPAFYLVRLFWDDWINITVNGNLVASAPVEHGNAGSSGTVLNSAGKIIGDSEQGMSWGLNINPSEYGELYDVGNAPVNAEITGYSSGPTYFSNTVKAPGSCGRGGCTESGYRSNGFATYSLTPYLRTGNNVIGMTVIVGGGGEGTMDFYIQPPPGCD